MQKPRSAKVKTASGTAAPSPQPPDAGSAVAGRFRAAELEQHIGKRLRFIRRLSGLTLQDIADEIGLSPQQVRKYESGLNRVSAVLLVEFSGMFSVPMAWFIGPFDPLAGTGEASGNEGYPYALDRLFRVYQERDEVAVAATLELIVHAAGLTAKSQQTPLTRLRWALQMGDAASRTSLLSMIDHLSDDYARLIPKVPNDYSGAEPGHEVRDGHRVLLVDDDPDVLSAVSTSLTKAGFKVATATRGIEALSELRKPLRFDVLVTDHNMMGMDGSELLLRAAALHPDLPAIVITGFADSDRLRELRPKIELLIKPFRQMELIGRIRLLIERNSKRSSP